MSTPVEAAPLATRPERGRKADALDLAIGRALKQSRRERGISAAALGEALGVTLQQIGRYEAGIDRISASTLIRACVSLGVEVGEFCAGVVAEGLGLPMRSPDAPRSIATRI